MDYVRENLCREVRRRIEKEYLFCEMGDKFYLQYIVDQLMHRGSHYAKEVPQHEFAQLILENFDPAELTVAEMRNIQRDLVEEVAA